MDSTLTIVIHNVAPIRAAPNGGSEQISQAILGDRVEVLEAQDAFVRVRTSDAYEGWVLGLHLRALPPEDRWLQRLSDPGAPLFRVITPFADLDPGSKGTAGPITKLVFGTPVSPLRRTDSRVRVLLPDGRKGWVHPEALESVSAPPRTLAEIVTFARRFIGTPYLWGGTTPFGFDCSGFVQRMATLAGLILPRDAYLQAQSPLGRRITAARPSQAGDLVFFCGPSDPRGRGITHVGLALNARQFLHASGRFGITITDFADPDFRSAYTYRGGWRYRRQGPANTDRSSFAGRPLRISP